MTAAHLHLMVVHLPVVGCPLVFLILLLGQKRQDESFLRLGYLLLAFCAVAAGVAFYSGPSAFEGLQAELAAERDLVESHAVLGRAAFIAVLAAGVLAIQAWLQLQQEEKPARWLRLAILWGTLACCYLLAWSAHL